MRVVERRDTDSSAIGGKMSGNQQGQLEDPWHTVPENDTRHDLEDDCTLSPFIYCGFYDLESDCGDESDYIRNMCGHIALRAFALGTSKAEEEA